MVVGLGLALAYHFLLMRLQRWVSTNKAYLLPAVTVGGFFIRVVLLVVILVLLGLFTPLNILATCLAFIVVYTVLQVVWVHGVVSKRRGAPPSAGAHGAH